MSKGFFVTGTDTNVGKTVLSALLCAALPGIYWKPIQTGAREGTDRKTVLGLIEAGEEGALPETYVFADPVSPHLASRWEKRKIKLDEICVPPHDTRLPLIVEGAGGALVPINESELMTDLIHHLALPAVLAARSTLGTINHTLLSLRALSQASVAVRGVVLIGPPNQDNREAIEHYGNVEVIGQIPHLESISHPVLLSVFAKHFNRAAFA